jgi:XTP/dITP diphosphohydrolase
MTFSGGRILVATTNPGKVRELDQLSRPLGIELSSLSDLQQVIDEPEEDGATFEANARIKALAYAKATNTQCLAEDSGLVVDALGGAPGVYSARYAGTTGSREERDARNNQKLLHELSGVPPRERSARYVCALCLVSPNGEVLAETRGTFEGRIGFEQRGTGGFGYDPLFVVPELGRTAAELTSEEKNARSHRGQAARALFRTLASSRAPARE